MENKNIHAEDQLLLPKDCLDTNTLNKDEMDHSIKRGGNGNYYFPVVSKFLYHVINDFWKLQIKKLRLLLNIVVR
jgi:hypothetical protein